MGVPHVDQAKRRLREILRRAHEQLEIPIDEVISTRGAQKILARAKNALAWTIIMGAFVLLLGGLVYLRWPKQDIETIRTVFRRACGGSTTRDFSERVAALLRSSSTQDDC